MTGLQPARELHTALFDISTDTVRQVLMAAALLLASVVVLIYFTAYIIPVVLGAMITTMVVEFFSDLHRGNAWSEDE